MRRGKGLAYGDSYFAARVQFKNSACALPVGKRDLFLICRSFLLDCNEMEWRAKSPASQMFLASNITSPLSNVSNCA